MLLIHLQANLLLACSCNFVFALGFHIQQLLHAAEHTCSTWPSSSCTVTGQDRMLQLVALCWYVTCLLDGAKTVQQLCSKTPLVQRYTTCAAIYHLCSDIPRVQRYTTCRAIYHLCSDIPRVQRYTTCVARYLSCKPSAHCVGHLKHLPSHNHAPRANLMAMNSLHAAERFPA